MQPSRQHLWFDIKEATSAQANEFAYDYKSDDFPESMTKCKQVILELNSAQKKIMNNWLNAYSLMFNETLKFIKEEYNINGTTMINFQKLRTCYLHPWK